MDGIREINPEIGDLVARNGGYCPCMVRKTEDTRCPCAAFRGGGECICGRYEHEQ